MPPKTWKRIELEICRIFGGKRSGPQGKEGPDCSNTEPFAVQVKHRKVPQWLLDNLQQAIDDADDDELPTLVLHPKGAPIDESIVMMRLDYFREWYL